LARALRPTDDPVVVRRRLQRTTDARRLADAKGAPSFGRIKDKSYKDELAAVIPLLAMPEKELRSMMADKLSGGQRHQLALAMTLAQRPRLLILDEPSAGLSPKSVEKMYEILTQVRERMNVSTILIEQNINKAIQFCDRSLLISQGIIAKEFVNKDINEVECVMFNR